MINRILSRVVNGVEDGVGQISTVPDVCPGLLVATVQLIKLIIKKSPPLVGGQPTLMSVLVSGVALAGKHDRVLSISDINQGEGVLIVSPADLIALVPAIRSTVVFFEII